MNMRVRDAHHGGHGDTEDAIKQTASLPVVSRQYGVSGMRSTDYWLLSVMFSVSPRCNPARVLLHTARNALHEQPNDGEQNEQEEQ